MSAHTPGPWLANSYSVTNDEIIISATNGDRIARALPYGEFSDNPDAQYANAKLIAAAPDLLQAVKALTWALERGEHCPTDEWNAALDLANAAVKKAGGAA